MDSSPNSSFQAGQAQGQAQEKGNQMMDKAREIGNLANKTLHQEKGNQMMDKAREIGNLANKTLHQGVLVVCFLVLAVAWLVVQPSSAEVTCLDITPAMVQCGPFVTGTLPQPTVLCCKAIRRLNEILRTTEDRHHICFCLKQYGSQYPNVQEGPLTALPKECGVPVPFSLSRNMNCHSKYAVMKPNATRCPGKVYENNDCDNVQCRTLCLTSYPTGGGMCRPMEKNPDKTACKCWYPC